MAEEFPLSDEKLDDLFVKNVNSVTKIVEKLPNNDITLTTCTRWFQIYQEATHDEKLARNFLLLLMHQQLNDKDVLSYPFTDPRSSQRDLNTLHRMSMRLQNRESMDDDDYDTNESIDCSTACSGMSNINPHLGPEDAKRQLIQLNSKMAKELHALQVEKERLLQRRQLSLANIKTLNEQSAMYQKEITYMKKMFLCSTITSLKMFTDGNPLTANTLPYFATLFAVLSETQQDIEQITRLDEMFAQTLRKHVARKIRETMCQQMNMEYDELRSKVRKQYNKIIENQVALQSQELSLSAMKNLMLLKKIFIESFKGDENVKSKIVTCLQNEFNEIQGEE